MITFAKAHAYGNDFIYVTSSETGGADLSTLARELCGRHTGIGADGLIVYDAQGTEASMRLFNADGSRAEVSGNGVRGLAALLLRNDPGHEADLTVHTEGGTKRVSRTGRDGARQTFRIAMGLPTGLRQIPLEVAGESLVLTSLNMGNPQCVLVGQLPGEGGFHRLGSALEKHPAFPGGTNVEFAQVEAPGRVRILIWERGVGPTSSSGTGSCAALVAAAAYAGADRDAEVIAPGGSQRVEWREDSVYLTGWAEVLCVGEWLRALPI
jgi:diaminopimelate epimerase